MARTVYIETPPDFSFRHTVYSHGWSELLPFELDESTWTLAYVFRNDSGAAVPVSITEADGRLAIKYHGQIAKPKLLRDVAHILRLDDKLEDFYGLTESEERLRWIANCKAGRLLRSPTVFEDLVKTLCTTNCSWALTRKMVSNMVEALGDKSANKSAFPTPEALASVPESFYRDEVRAGYRSP
jgi:N-glycosylase/DNA lyase